MAEKKLVTIPISNVVPGMVAARDIYSKNEQLLIGKDSIIDVNSIARITFFGILSVVVYVDENVEVNESEEELIFENSEEKKIYENFNQKYKDSLSDVEYQLNQLLKVGEDIDEKQLIQDVETVVISTGSKYHVFDMLQYIKEYDDETFNHSLNVAMICNVFADWVKMSEYEKKHLTLCGILHDFGKLLISKDILRKPGKLSENEYEIIKQHPAKGYEFLKNKKIHESVKRAVLLHHERCDGKGYPFGMRVNEIDPYASITAIADVYEAMTATRVYRKGLSPFRVIKLFEEEGRQQFNPIFLMPILHNLTNTYLQHKVKLSDDTIGKIIMINKNELSRPIVMIENEFIDLSKKRELTITEVY